MKILLVRAVQLFISNTYIKVPRVAIIKHYNKKIACIFEISPL